MTKPTIKAIETRYKGHRFRSRLEARWAVFFDAAGWDWEHEPGGFHTPLGPYLPDFLVSSFSRARSVCGRWLEVKPIEPSPVEIDKLVWVSAHNDITPFAELVIGPPINHSRIEILANPDRHMLSEPGAEIRYVDSVPVLVVRGPKRDLRDSYAVAASAQARFEYGESGAA
ncbi:MAG: hypothetical protein ACK5VI_10180 [Opitutia bacterium]